MSPRKRTPPEQAAYIAKWATTMAKWGIANACTEKKLRARGARWRVIDFPGPNGGESRGIVDAIAIRKDHCFEGSGFKRGDKLQIVLLQIKGGAAAWPTNGDVSRLRRVQRAVGASAVVLVRWSPKKYFEYHQLKPHAVARARSAWVEVEAADIFGRHGRLAKRASTSQRKSTM